MLSYMCVSRTPTQDILSLTSTRTCWPKLLSLRKLRKGDNAHLLQLHLILLYTTFFVTTFYFLLLLPIPVSVFPFMRRQRHSSPSPAQAVAQATEEDGRAKQTGQAGTNSAASSHVWYWAKSTRPTWSPPSPLYLLVTIATIQGVPLLRFVSSQTVCVRELFVSTAATLPELRFQCRASSRSTGVNAYCTSVVLHLSPRAWLEPDPELLVLLLQHIHPASTSHLSPKT